MYAFFLVFSTLLDMIKSNIKITASRIANGVLAYTAKQNHSSVYVVVHNTPQKKKKRPLAVVVSKIFIF